MALRFATRLLYLAHAITDKSIGLEDVDDEQWLIYFNTVLLASFIEHDYLIHDNKLYDMQLMSERVAVATVRQRFIASLLGLLAAVALSLAAVGIYGVIALSVAGRTREIGIRMALGANRVSVQRLVVGEGMTLVAVGAAIGLVGALASTRVLQSLLFDLGASDPMTYLAALVVLAVAAVLASWIPARRASRVDPVTAFRTE